MPLQSLRQGDCEVGDQDVALSLQAPGQTEDATDFDQTEQIQEATPEKVNEEEQIKESAPIFKGTLEAATRRRDSLDLFEKAFDHGTVSMKAKQDEFLSDEPFVVAAHSYMDKKYME